MKIGDKIRVVDDQVKYSKIFGYKDLTGYYGVITHVTEPFKYKGCVFYGVDATLTVDGSEFENINFDSDEIEVINE